VRVADPKACQCGEVLKGVIKPWECKVFGTACTPERPIGTCMVSSEGACAAYYNFGRFARDARSPIRSTAFAAAVLAILIAAAPAFAGISGPVLVSGPSPFASCTVGGPGTNYPNAEVEPWVAVNPADSTNVVGVFQQDRWSNGGAHGLVTGVSHNGGGSWSETWAHLSACAGGTATNGGGYDRSSDPWVTFAPNGTAYQISISISADEVTSAVLVAGSTNGGDSWSEPITLIRDDTPFNFNDKESITADPTNASYAYAVWDRARKPGENADFNALHSFAFRGDVLVSRTTNGGTSWEPARRALPTNANLFTIGNRIAVRPKPRHPHTIIRALDPGHDVVKLSRLPPAHPRCVLAPLSYSYVDFACPHR